MHADPRGVLTGVHFLDGDHACCEGTLAAGARFASGYPITPSTEVVERFAARIPTVGGVFIQMEDELAASIAIQGAVWGGAKAFTVTSGPGFSLMMEHIGYAAITETPCVFVDVQRGGPSTGLPTLPAQADMMQARWGSHGDYGIIALCPNSPQECFDLTITGFNLAEEFRVPVMMMLDECVGHMTEKVVILDKLKPLADSRAMFETENLDDADVVVVSYGITSRVAQRAIQLARARGAKVGKFRIISAWPFPEPHIARIASQVKAFVVPELNMGQMALEVARAAAGKAAVIPVSHAGGGVHNPDVILKAIL
jgi:pyruvate/2-oxoacid:ferredoxin oxidoreductase alpha subunit